MDNNTTVTVNGKTYALNDSFKREIEQIAENEYGDNDFLSYYWRVADDSDDDHNEGDALLCIETEGKMVPWDKLSEFEMQMESVGPQFIMPDDSTDDSDHSDNGNGTQSIDGDSISASGDDTIDDFKLPMFPRGYRPIPDADDGRFDTVPPAPKKYDESEPILLVPIPMDTREERWAAGEAMIPVSTYVEWNMQRRADVALTPHPRTEQNHTDTHTISGRRGWRTTSVMSSQRCNQRTHREKRCQTTKRCLPGEILAGSLAEIIGISNTRAPL
jgi:hypothetical protein